MPCTIANLPVNIIVDTGASASFLPAAGKVLKHRRLPTLAANVKAGMADNSIIQCSWKTRASTQIAAGQEATLEYLLIPERMDILGRDAVIGLDGLKKLSVGISPIHGVMCATINGVVIGREQPIKLSLLSIAPMETAETRLAEMLHVYQDVFSEQAIKCMRTAPLTINLTTTIPIAAKLQRHSLEDIQEIGNQVKRLLDTGVIEPSISPYASRAHLVPKKSGEKRLVINFMPLNAVTIKDRYPLPQIADLFNALHGANFFCALDCTDGFFQIPVRPDHCEKTAFVTPQGLFHYTRCPFGFTNSPAAFQRAMNQIFYEGLYKRCVIYIDDLLVFGKSAEECLDNLEWVFQKSREYDVQLKYKKCKFLQQQVEFLGHLITLNRVAPVADKFTPLLSNAPENKTDVLAILGSLNYYAKFIPNYAELTKPLREIVRLDNPFAWGEKQRQAIDTLKSRLDGSTGLLIADPHSPKTIEVYANLTTIEAICSTEEGELISHASGSLSHSQYNYSLPEKHLLAIVLAYAKFGPILRGKVRIKTDCKALKGALGAKERAERVDRLMMRLPPDAEFEIVLSPRAEVVENKLRSPDPPDEVFYTDGACTRNGKPDCRASWAVLATHNPHLSCTGMVEHMRPTNQIAELTAVAKACEIAATHGLAKILIVTDSKYAAEAMNRWIDTWQETGWKDSKGKRLINQDMLATLAGWKSKLDISCLHVKGHSTDKNNNIADQMARKELEASLTPVLTVSYAKDIDQTGDLEVDRIVRTLQQGPDPECRFALKDGRLYFMDARLPINQRERLFVPAKYREDLLRAAHDDPIFGGHLGVRKTRGKLSSYYWPNMIVDVENYLRTCGICQKLKNPKGPKYGLLKPICTSRLFQKLHIDVVGPLKPSAKGHTHIVTAIDAFSRFAFARSYKQSPRSQDVVSFVLTEVIARHGIPEEIVSDNGAIFNSTLFKSFMKDVGARSSYTCYYHPSANGKDERFNGSLMKILRNFVDHNQLDWDRKLIWALKVYNESPHEAIGASPYRLLYGVEPRTPLDQHRASAPCEEQAATHTEIREEALRRMDASNARTKQNYDRNRQEATFAIGDLVYFKRHSVPSGTSRKLADKWRGPAVVVAFVTHEDQARAIEILDMETFTKVKVPFQDLKPCFIREKRPRNPTHEDSIALPGDAVVEVQDSLPSPEPGDAPVPHQLDYLGSNNPALLRSSRSYAKRTP